MILRIALRNVLRQRRRSALTALAIVLSFALLLVLTGIADGAHEQMAEMGVRMGLGDVVVYAEGYRDDPSIDHRIEHPEQIVAEARGLSADLDGVATRLQVDGLVQAGTTAMGASLWGVDPRVEGDLSKVGAPEAIVKGRALGPDDVTPPPGTPPPIVIGEEMARTLGVEIGDRLTITVKAAGAAETAGASPPSATDATLPSSSTSGGMRTGAFLVMGIYATGVREVDAHVVLAPIASVQALTGAGSGVTMIALLLRHASETPDVADGLARRLTGRGVEVLPWQKAAPELYATIALDEASMYLMMVIVYVVVAAGILNTILVSVMQRTRELGVVLALGATPGYVVRLVLIEATTLGIFSVGVGLVLGLLANHHFTTAGLGFDVGHLEASGVLIPSHFYADLAPAKIAWSTAAVLALVLASAIYPAVRAGRLEPVEAMRHV